MTLQTHAFARSMSAPSAASDWPFDVRPLTATFGAEITGLRLVDLPEEAFQALKVAWLEYGLLIFPGQHLTKEQQITFARRLGPLEFEFGELSNVTPGGALRPVEPGTEDDMIRILKGNMDWHQDSTFMPVQARGAVFSAVTVPPDGGETAFADMAAAYDALPPLEQQRLERLTAFHSLAYSQSKLGHVHRKDSAYAGYGMTVANPPRRPLIKVHPTTGRKALAIGRHAYAVNGLNEVDSDALIAHLREAACQPPRLWTHTWTPGDVIMWDNLRLLHRALPWDMRQPRVMWHSRIAGDPMTEAA